MDELLSPEDVERRAAEAGLSLKQVIERAGIAHTTFYRWRSGKTTPSIKVYRRILDALRAEAV